MNASERCKDGERCGTILESSFPKRWYCDGDRCASARPPAPPGRPECGICNGTRRVGPRDDNGNATNECMYCTAPPERVGPSIAERNEYTVGDAIGLKRDEPRPFPVRVGPVATGALCTCTNAWCPFHKGTRPSDPPAPEPSPRDKRDELLDEAADIIRTHLPAYTDWLDRYEDMKRGG